MKTVVIMMLLSIVYMVAMDIANKKLSSIDFSNNAVVEYESSESSYLQVKITGAVNNPGTYTVLKGETLQYLITLAGGVKDNADSSAYNTSIILSSNSTYYIASISEDKIEKVSINEANLALLDTLPGIGSVLASRIISYRTSNGKFTSLEDLTKVSGIGSSLFEQIKDLICL